MTQKELPPVLAVLDTFAKGSNLVLRAGLGASPSGRPVNEAEHGAIIFQLPDGAETLRIEPDGSFYINGIRVDNVDAEDVFHALSAWLQLVMPQNEMKEANKKADEEVDEEVDKVVVHLSGTSIDANGVSTPNDTEDVTILRSDPIGTYRETTKRWIGIVEEDRDDS